VNQEPHSTRYCLVLYFFTSLTMSVRRSFPTFSDNQRTVVLFVHVRCVSARLSLSTLHVWPRAFVLLCMSDYERPFVLFYLTCLIMSARRSFPTLHVWLCARARPSLLYMSDHERLFVFFYFTCLIMSVRTSSSTQHVWSQTNSCPFPLWMSHHEHAISFYFAYLIMSGHSSFAT